jgi:hypothetical protein
MSFRSQVAALFPLARSLTLLSFAILFLSYYNDPNPVIGACTLVFGAMAIVAIIITPTEKS